MLLYLPCWPFPWGYPPQQEPALQTPSSAPVVTGPSPQSKLQHNLPDWVKPPSQSETTPKLTPKEPPIQSRRRKHSSIKPCQGVTRKLSAGISDWCKRWERILTKKTAHTLTVILHVTWWTFSRAWSNPPAYYALKSMRSRKLGLGGTNCSMPTML